MFPICIMAAHQWTMVGMPVAAREPQLEEPRHDISFLIRL